MGEDLSPAQRRFQILLSSVFTVGVSAFALFMIGVALVQWLDGELSVTGALGLIVLNVAVGYFLGVRPLWNSLSDLGEK